MGGGGGGFPRGFPPRFLFFLVRGGVLVFEGGNCSLERRVKVFILRDASF